MQVPFHAVDGSVTSVGKCGFDESIQGGRRDGVGRSRAINVLMMILPLDGPALPDRLARAVRFASIRVTGEIRTDLTL